MNRIPFFNMIKSTTTQRFQKTARKIGLPRWQILQNLMDAFILEYEKNPEKFPKAKLSVVRSGKNDRDFHA